MSEASADGALFGAAFREAALGMALIGPDGSWLHVNQALCLMFGYASSDELTAEGTGLGARATALLPDAELQRALLEGRSPSQCFERRYAHRNGHPVWASLTVSLARDGEQMPRFFIVQVQDVSERHMREAEARAFFEQSLDLMAIASLQGSFIQLSPSWEAVLGYSEGELTSRPFLEFVHPEDHERTLGAIEQLKAGKEVRAFRNRYRAKNGQYHWLDWNTRPDEDGRLFCVARDVTAHIELEEQIRQASLVDELTGLSNRRGFFLLGSQNCFQQMPRP